MAKVINDPRLNSQSNPMPFDGKRMIFGRFAPVLEFGTGTYGRLSAKHSEYNGSHSAPSVTVWPLMWQ